MALVEGLLQEGASAVMDWYDSNYLKGNYKKYSSMIISKRIRERDKYQSQGLYH